MKKIVREKIYPDLTKVEKSVGARIEHLVSTIDQYKTVDSLKNAFLDIIESPDTNISIHKIKSYKNDLSTMYSLPRVRNFILNIYMKSANLGLS